jgi:Kef-type K+ transport system membrane component KefB
MFAGIVLGPSLLGWVSPHLSGLLFPPSSLTFLNLLSQVGVILYMFLVGLSSNPETLKHQGHAAVLTSHASVMIPLVLGAALALFLYPGFAGDHVGFTGFALFLGASMSITAFPVLARILTDRQMLGTRLGALAIACAAVDDVTGWCILAYILLIVRSQTGGPASLGLALAGLGSFLLLMLLGVKRLARRFEQIYRKRECLPEGSLALLIVFVFLSAATSESLGFHSLFGAFLAGFVMPKHSGLVRHIRDKFETAIVVVLLPLYFACTGLRTSVRLIKTPQMWLLCLVIVLVAIAGKLGGSMLAARAAGAGWQHAVGLGILMNTRGLMELVILNIGLDAGVISPALFSMMVIMALTTTFLTTPLLECVYPMRLLQAETRELQQAAARKSA